MTRQQEFFQTIDPKTLFKRGFQGAGIGLVLLTLFFILLLTVGNVTDTAWMYTPAATLASGGFCGGIFYYGMNHLRQYLGWSKIWVAVFCGLAYAVALWGSLVFGLSLVGLWD